MRRPFAPTVPFCTAPAHAGLCLGAGGRVEGPGLQVQPVRCEGTTLRQAGRALPSRPVRFLAAPRHPARPPLRWEGGVRCSPLVLEGTRPLELLAPTLAGEEGRVGVRAPCSGRASLGPPGSRPLVLRCRGVGRWRRLQGCRLVEPPSSGPGIVHVGGLGGARGSLDLCAAAPGRPAPGRPVPATRAPSAGKAVSRAALSFRDVSRGPA